MKQPGKIHTGGVLRSILVIVSLIAYCSAAEQGLFSSRYSSVLENKTQLELVIATAGQSHPCNAPSLVGDRTPITWSVASSGVSPVVFFHTPAVLAMDNRSRLLQLHCIGYEFIPPYASFSLRCKITQWHTGTDPISFSPAI
ncbi:MAG: hypothetical protein JW795_04185 [Chitinivibrionales bacterium]|nr:hypothetical protein [Chitinivibrionales bacterium]